MKNPEEEIMKLQDQLEEIKLQAKHFEAEIEELKEQLQYVKNEIRQSRGRYE